MKHVNVTTLTRLSRRVRLPLLAVREAFYHGTPIIKQKPLPPRPKLEDNDITENFLKGSGPGGQKINKTNSSVQLIHHPTGIVVKCQETRSRVQNRKIARQHLAERLELLEKGDESRVAQKAERAKKKKASASKKSRRKYRKLDEAKDGSTTGQLFEADGESNEGAEDYEAADDGDCVREQGAKGDEQVK